MPAEYDAILQQLAREVESAVHALYRGDVKQSTARARTGQYVRAAADALAKLAPASAAAAGSPSPRPNVGSPAIPGASVGWDKDESAAVMKCVMAWLPTGTPSTTPPTAKAVAAGRELSPTWGERELARAALRKLDPR
ncbi:MAG: hypothetical protein K2X99_09955 [Gemmatimonadaceae bacterium]|nr:hypothetical protein [Gemmatimonadaceae bacterium]